MNTEAITTNVIKPATDAASTTLATAASATTTTDTKPVPTTKRKRRNMFDVKPEGQFNLVIAKVIYTKILSLTSFNKI